MAPDEILELEWNGFGGLGRAHVLRDHRSAHILLQTYTRKRGSRDATSASISEFQAQGEAR
jgi:hypothetical protein